MLKLVLDDTGRWVRIDFQEISFSTDCSPISLVGNVIKVVIIRLRPSREMFSSISKANLCNDDWNGCHNWI